MESRPGQPPVRFAYPGDLWRLIGKFWGEQKSLPAGQRQHLLCKPIVGPANYSSEFTKEDRVEEWLNSRRPTGTGTERAGGRAEAHTGGRAAGGALGPNQGRMFT